jgi:hypothetical protein
VLFILDADLTVSPEELPKFHEVVASGAAEFVNGAAKLNLRILDLPTRYQARTCGTTNISRWRHGWLLLLRMLGVAARRLKFG